MNNGLTEILSAGANKAHLTYELTGTELTSEVTGDYILPDYLPDIEKLLLVRAEARPGGNYLEDGHIDFEGDVIYNIIYMSEGGKLNGAVYSEGYSGSVTLPEAENECNMSIMTGIVSVTARPTNPRKLNIKTKLSTQARVYCTTSVEPEIRGRRTIEDEMGLEKLVEQTETMEILTADDDGIGVSEDIELDSGAPSVKELISCRVSIVPIEARISDGEVETRCDAEFECLYETEDGGCFKTSKKFPLTRSTSAIGLKPGCECIITAVPGNVKASPQNNSYGERRIIELDFPYSLHLTFLKNSQVGYVKDIYSVDWDSDAELTDTETVCFRRAYSSGVSVNASAPRGECDAEAALTVLDGSATVSAPNIKFLPDRSRLVAEGTLKADIIVRNDTSRDGAAEYSPVSIETPYKCELDASDNLDGADYRAEAFVTSKRFRLDSSSVYADIELSFRIYAFGKEPVSRVVSVSLDRESPNRRQGAPMTLYYPERNETLWEIAKHYKTTVNAIKAINASAPAGVLLIPDVSRPSYSRVI